MSETTLSRIEIENVLSPGHVTRVDAAKYHGMKQAMMTVLPAESPGLTAAELRVAILPHLPQDLFPGGAKAGWWKKAVQLDLEAKGIIVREATKPLRWRKP
jgi:hypothetical protein